MSEVLSQVMQYVGKRFKVDPSKLKPNDDFFETLGINSLQALDLLGDLELEFGVEVPDYALKETTTFEGIAKVIERAQ
ncbi:MAG: phosphopantetheine-binding protein [bacterium]